MPRRTDIERVLVIGSGPIVIGQACEFDYSGTQACKALRAEGIEVILVNSNPATIMTDPGVSDRTYVEPLTWEVVRKVIAEERPDALLPTVGGQTALNLAVDLQANGVLDEFGVSLIGASIDAIMVAEDRLKFRDAMESIGIEVPESAYARSIDEAMSVVDRLGFPAIVRPSFTLGGVGGGIAYNIEEFRDVVTRGIELSPGARDPHRGVGHRLEGVRARGDARRRRQLRRRLLDREHRPHGRAHRRQHHGGAGPDPHRQGVPAECATRRGASSAASGSRPAARTSSSR